jgi:hypothetical protein
MREKGALATNMDRRDIWEYNTKEIVKIIDMYFNGGIKHKIPKVMEYSSLEHIQGKCIFKHERGLYKGYYCNRKIGQLSNIYCKYHKITVQKMHKRRQMGIMERKKWICSNKK